MSDIKNKSTEVLQALLSDLEAEQKKTKEWGAAVGARNEHIKEIRAELYLRKTNEYKTKIDEARILDIMAAEALNGMLSHSLRYQPRDPNQHWHKAIAEEAYEIAEAMVEVRRTKS